MANGLLISYSGYPYTPSSLCPDNGLAGLAAVLQLSGHAVRILDYGTVSTMARLYPEPLSRRAGPLMAALASSAGRPDEELRRRLVELDRDLETHQASELAVISEEISRQVSEIGAAFVGFKLWNGDGFLGTIAIARRLRELHPGLRLIAGGPHATWFRALIHELTDVFDAIAVGEAEDKIGELADRAAAGRDFSGIPGVTCGASEHVEPTSAVDLARVPAGLYDTDTYPAMAGNDKLKLVIIDESRGCPYGCAFCAHPVESGRRLRLRPPELVVQDIEALVREHRIRAFRFAGSSTPGSLMRDVAAGIIDRGLDVRYCSFAHFASSDPAHFELLRRSGLHAMFFGLECGCPELLKRATGKPIRLDRIGDTVQAAKNAGIVAVCSMIVPMPFETEQTMQESLELLKRLAPDYVPVSFPGLLPGTPWFTQAEEYGFEVDKDEYLRQNLGYKFKMLFPPEFWEPLPYRLNGRNFAQFTRDTRRFIEMLEQAGIVTGLTDDHALMAELSGIDARELRDLARLWCATGDAASMQGFVESFNQAACVPVPGDGESGRSSGAGGAS